MITLTTTDIAVKLHPVGARIAACNVEGHEVAFGAGPQDNILSGDIYAGAVCGRHAGRISNARIVLDGKSIDLIPSAGSAHQLHGGDGGFHMRRWDWLQDGNRVVFTLQSGDGDQGFPGHLSVTASYRLLPDRLTLTLEARTSRPTVCNLTNHAYWNMAGGGSVLTHELQMPGSRYFPLDDLLLPLGTVADVSGTPWDFRTPRAITNDHDGAVWLDGKRGEMKQGLTLRDPTSGRRMEVWTTEQVMQTYTAIHWTPEMTGHLGPLARSQALAIEPQNVADAPNHPAFPSSILRPGEVYHNAMEWRFF
jgi:aldose 1-epimerase